MTSFIHFWNYLSFPSTTNFELSCCEAEKFSFVKLKVNYTLQDSLPFEAVLSQFDQRYIEASCLFMVIRLSTLH